MFCFPYAGGGAAIFRSWATHLAVEADLTAVELPGRGGRIKEPAFRSMAVLVQQIADAIAPHTTSEFAFFGHSMGAMIAFELSRELRRRGLPGPRHLFVSGREAPQLPDTDPFTFNLPEPEFIKELHRLNGTPKEVLEHEELMKLVIPLLRADFELIQTYKYHNESPLPAPISAYGGLEDHEVSRDRLMPWKDQTESAFSLHMLPGDHFFLRSAQSDLLGLISGELRKNGRPGL